MKHKKAGRKFGRESHQRAALFRSLTSSLVKYEKITTTLQKAKDLRRIVEKAVTMAKKANAEKNPQLLGYLHSPEDKELIGRDLIKKFISNLTKEVREKIEKFMDDPKKNEKPDYVVQYLASEGERKKGPRILRLEGLLSKLVNKIAPRFKDINGGYTQIFKLGVRRGDSADMAVIQFTR